MDKKLTHLNDEGEARMVDVSGKEVTNRRAVAMGEIRMQPETVQAITGGSLPKGDVFAAARIAGILAAKKTAELIPLCHPLPISFCEVRFTVGDNSIKVEAEVKVTGITGVEMEAITAVSMAAITIYDMCKAIDKDMVIEGIQLLEKDGGKSGSYRRNG